MLFTQSLKQNHLFRCLYRRGDSAASRYLVLYCRRNGQPGNRVGLTVSAKLGHAVRRNRLRRRLREIYRLMHDIVSVCHETCHLGSLKNGDVYYLKKVETPLRSRTVTVEGRSLPAYATGVGKALLADYQLPQLKALYYDGLYPLTEHTITDFRLLADQLAEIRASGFAYECEESTRGIRCIGVPLRKSGKVVAALSVAFPLERYSDAAAASARQALDEARRQIERMLCSVELQF